MKKIYNPFKMFGSYIGSLIGLFLGISVHIMNSLILITNNNNFSFNTNNIVLKILLSFFTYTQTYYFAICGFIIGYIIHALFRKLK